ncbi:MAG: D-tyrosyl-tRNA(Tyr) deacylase [Phycisphaerae bacterium]|nr:D-tyrosyl-tRNA(Tyr) deacylase [Phycisphaerae bacterium]HBZ96480.1 D-tyrosyl-tRNA(Tyr) deacylase [Phycisphaerales bacterium]|tara:strand:- start:431 stop:889 length:459 start_codon:yes stop_codon:yes gene_type:complete
MIAVVQRVDRASVRVEDPPYEAEIRSGLLVLLGVEEGDSEAEADWMAGRIARLRIFRDEDGRMNRSVLEVGGEVLVVSQFTLAADTARGNRPSFVRAAPPELAESLYERVMNILREVHAVRVGSGRFGAMMAVSLVNDGPVTIILKSSDSEC